MSGTTYTIKVTSSTLYVRKDPRYLADGSNIKGNVKAGSAYTATKEQNGWYYVPSLDGWLHSTSWGASTMTVSKTAPPAQPAAPAKPAATKPKETPKSASKSLLDGVTTTTVSVNNSNQVNVASLSVSKEESLGVEVHHPVIYRNGQFSRSIDYINGLPGSLKLNNNIDSRNMITNNIAGDYRDFEDAFASVRKNNNIFGIDDRVRLFREFNRFKSPMPDYHAPKVIPYIFFTKPKLDLVHADGELRSEFKDEKGNSKKTNTDDALFAYLFNDQPNLFYSLDAAYGKDLHKFNAFLSNTATSFQTSDEVLKTVEHGETYTGWKMVYGRHTNESNTAGQLSIGYVDSYNYDIYKMHKLWVEYINRVYRGEIYPGKNNIWKKILNYTCAVYYIVCAADGETVLYWSKYYGVFPINTPASVSSFTHGSPESLPEFNITYMYSIKEDFNPLAIREFNMMSSGQLKYRAIYNSSNQSSSQALTGAPYIDDIRVSEDGIIKRKFKLRFRDKDIAVPTASKNTRQVFEALQKSTLAGKILDAAKKIKK